MVHQMEISAEASRTWDEVEEESCTKNNPRRLMFMVMVIYFLYKEGNI
jgi:hypothetical protein